MKIHLSSVWRQRAQIMLFLLVCCLVGPIAVNLYYGVTGVERFLMPIFAFPGVVASIWVLQGDIRRLTHVIPEEHQFTAYSVFNKKLYTLDLTRPVYYGIFNARQDLFYFNDFIALSNEPFKFEEDKDWRYFIVRYDLNTLLVMPYNDKTKPLMQLEKWERIYELPKRV